MYVSAQSTSNSAAAATAIAPWQRDLNDAQIEAVTKPLYSVTRVIAGPGSGKTRVLTSRIAYILKEDPQARILAVTFTRKAAGEMQQRLETLLKASASFPHTSKQQEQQLSLQSSSGEAIVEEEFSEGAAAPTYIRELSRATLGTFHKICADILRYNGNLLATLPSITDEMLGRGNATLLDGGFAIMDQSDQLRIMKECLKLASIDLKDLGVKPMDVLNALSDVKAKINKGEDPFQADPKKKKKPKQVEIAQKIYGIYRESMLSNNLLDFDDLIYLSRELLMENQDVRQQLHRRWTHILVDEYQDTSRAQIDLVRLWTSSSLLVVGDGDQSIYSWRGADPRSLAAFEKEFKAYMGNIETVHLTENYRSTSNIVNAAHKVIASGEKSSDRQKMNPQRGAGSTPRIVACADGKAEGTFVVKNIQKMLASGHYNPSSTVAILYRTNAQSRLLEEACVNNNLPYVILGKATSFYKRREVKDCLCFLRWLYNGRDKGSMIRAFQTPSRGLGEKGIEQFEDYCSLVDGAAMKAGRVRPSQLDILLSFPYPEAEEEESMVPLRKDIIATRPLKLFTEFARQMEALKEQAYAEPVEKVLAYVIDGFDLIAHFDKTSDSKAEFEERQSNVQELQTATRRYTENGPCLQNAAPTVEDKNALDLGSIKTPLGAFLDDVALVTETAAERDENGSNKQDRFVVSLMTIHASKGMEFDGVFVAGNEDDNFPSSRAIQAGKGSVELAEECRLCYVAMTRAKSDLFMTWRREAAVFTPTTDSGFRYVKRNRSRFLDALVSKKKGATESSSDEESPRKRRQNGALPFMDTEMEMEMDRANNRARKNGLVSPGRKKKTSSSDARYRPGTSSSRDDSDDTSRSFSTGPSSDSLEERLKRVVSSSPANKPKRVTAGSVRSNPSRPSSATANGRSPPQQRSISTTTAATTTTRRAPPPPTTRSTAPGAASAAFPPPPAPPQPTRPKQASASATTRRRATAAMDSTWFYPVGSFVIHTRHGRGLVLNPPPPSDDAANSSDLLVRVKFEDGGETLDVSAQGDDLRPQL